MFLKAPNTLTGDNQTSVRPNNIEYMHYEAELVVVIGKQARNVSEADAMDYVAGYTVCNDYAIRDYLENYYRPNPAGQKPRRTDADAFNHRAERGDPGPA
ncbi:4-hydroxyphenylacetate degradation bifunctional isomerase/decarboxylase [Escherichia coli]|uniref:4-hydroxyphenylacetate degradation bifunctional isomerase/decarboxylase n=1 Tax=Escherichia coli TaxID=562 RepID=A0A376L367_ECOLX|nr:4-hydroxyphenylacetate degradation bifunctional isomerase/decarboxylase [Escherichia coli]